MKYTSVCPGNGLNTVASSDLLFWAQLFLPDSVELDSNKLGDGTFLNEIFQQIDGRTQDGHELCKTPETVKARLGNWQYVLQNLRNYYLEVLQEAIIMRPPNIVLISKLPNSAQAHQEREQILLLLLCAAVRCDRRDYFIRQIMERLTPEVQAGIMDCIKNFTENPDCVMSFDRMQSSAPDVLRVLKTCINQLEDVYLQEIRELLDQLEALQHKFTSLQARVRLTCRGRARSVGRLTLSGRTGSTVSLGDPTRGEMTTSTPRLATADALHTDCGALNKTASPSVSQLTETMGDGDGERRTVLDDDEVITSERNDLAQVFLFDSGLDVDVDVEHTQSISTFYPDVSDNSMFADRDRHHLAVELAETKARLRRVRSELEDQADQVAELHDQLTETRRELSQVKEERARLADAAHSARHWQDEVDALRETAERVSKLEADNTKLKQRVHELDYYKVRCQQLTEDLAILSDENAKRSSLVGHVESSDEKIISLEHELRKTRTLLAQVEELRNSDLDEIQNLREELGRLGLENAARQQQHKSHANPDQSDAESIASHASFTAALSKQLNDSVAIRLDQLESENRRLKRELEKARCGARDQSVEQTSSPQTSRSSDSKMQQVYGEMKRLKSSWNRCTKEIDGANELLNTTLKELSDQKISQESMTSNLCSLNDRHGSILEAIRTHEAIIANITSITLRLAEHNRVDTSSIVKAGTEGLDQNVCNPEMQKGSNDYQDEPMSLEEKICQIEAERDSLVAQLRKLRRKYKIQTCSRTPDEPLSADDEDDEDSKEDGDMDEADSNRKTGTDGEEADSGNKTGDSTEETDQFGLDKLKRKTFNLPGTNSTRYRERRRRTRTSLESELTRLSAEIEQLEEANKQLTNQLAQRDTECQAKSDELQAVKRQLETVKRQVEIAPNPEKVNHLEAEVKRLKLAVSSAELETRKARRELREVQTNPVSTQQGKLLASKISHLEAQLAKATQAQLTTANQNESRVKQLEQEQNGLSQQLGVERQTVLTLREQLVEAKIELQEQGSALRQFQLDLEALGVDKTKAQGLFVKKNSNDCSSATLQDLIDGLVHQAVEKKNAEIKRLEEQLKQVQLPSPTTKSTEARVISSSGDMLSNEMGGEKQTQLLVQFKNRLVELERENARLELERSTESLSSEEARIRVSQLEKRLTLAQDQVIAGQSQLAELIATNARLQVESTTLHNQLDSLGNQNDALFRRNTELEGEANRLRAMVESAHAAEAHLTADYYHLQRLHEKLTRDYDTLGLSLKEAKESQRRMKNELSDAQIQIERLQSATNQVLNLKEALEFERGSLKGEAKQMVVLREDCARLRAQIDSITDSRDHERSEKVAAVERAREARRQLEECEGCANRLKIELNNQRNTNQKIQIEVAELRSRVQMLSDMNEKLEKDNRSLVLQLQSLLSQNQELLASAMESCTHRVVEEGSLRERLLSLQRQKQHLEDKIMEQYRNGPQPKNDVTDAASPGPQKRLNLVQKAKAALAKRKDSLNSHQNDVAKNVNGPTSVRDTLQSIQSQNLLSNESSGSSNSLSSSSMRKSQSTNRLVPGSVSVYDRDPNECDTSEFHVFLKRLDSTSSTSSRPNRSLSLRVGEDKCALNGSNRTSTNGHTRSNHMDLTPTNAKSPRTPPSDCINQGSFSPTSAVIRSSRHPSGDQPHYGYSTRTNGLPRSNSSLPVDQFHQQHHFPHQAMNAPLDALRTKSEFAQPDHGRSRSEVATPPVGKPGFTDPHGHRYRPLPCTDRCEKQLCEIVTTKSTSEEYSSIIVQPHSRSGSEVSRSSSIHSFASSSNSNQPGLAGNSLQPSPVTAPQRTASNSMASTTGKPQRSLAPLCRPDASSNGLDSPTPKSNRSVQAQRWVSNSKSISNGHEDQLQFNSTQANSMESMYGCRSPRFTTATQQNDSWESQRNQDDLDQKPTLEVVGRPRVLLEYGDL